ncbi:uncharacterized protein LOC123880108 isoform X1 [Maniola jurtina]|uniref:uncharacterized protein LOC123880108 isoform X1 n=1 Tax=Maniola jurtina TaxID=191418 RepID=UPI001E68A9B3|nr:uncharacterized protein LOC123880108 isoform X1 [Maniola jurtina]
MPNQNDSLFLLEVLIDKVVFVKSPCFSDKDFRTCVNIQCPGVEPLEICDDEPGACIAKSTGPFIKSFNNGKSCLFSLTESDISKAMAKYPIKISVYKSLPCGCLPTKITMGECEIDMTKEFVEARKTFLEDPTNVSYQALKDSFRIVGPDGSETGEIVMFLRISCFGNLIITKFQGPGGSPNLGNERGSAIVDRSCAPNKDFQSIQDPCACGAARGSVGGTTGAGQPCDVRGGTGVCTPARDPYNSMPCENPDDPCYCSGPKSQPKEQMVCRNTDQYCLHVPKGTWLKMPSYQELKNEKSLINIKHNLQNDFSKEHINKTQLNILDYLKLLNAVHGVPSGKHIRYTFAPELKSTFSKTESNKGSMTFNESEYSWESYTSVINPPIRNTSNITNKGLFGIQETSVYMTLSDNFCRNRTSSTQATASINKCFQVSNESPHSASTIAISTDYCSTCTVSTLPYRASKQVPDTLTNPKIYFFGRKKNESKQKGMGSTCSHTKLQKTSQTSTHAIKSERKSPRSSLGSDSNTSMQKSKTVSKPKPSKTSKGAATTIVTSKTVTIKDEKQLKPCPALKGMTKGDMTVTVSHIIIGPKESCPVHGNEPCQGPKCVLASSGEEQGPVKVTSVNNPRRGVFEIVIRKLTGAPLAKNELMLEWTPPPSRPPTCSGPCPLSCLPSGSYRPSKCKLIVCRPAKHSKCCKKKPCGQPCSTLPCKPCRKCYKKTCCGSPCNPCKPCLPPSCSAPCGRPACASPCKSSPCLRPCPVGRKRQRRSRSQPKIKSHHKRISPCYNRSKTCPVVRCSSVPGPCIGCCSAQPLCLPLKCCSSVPCKPPKACASACSSCCG